MNVEDIRQLVEQDRCDEIGYEAFQTLLAEIDAMRGYPDFEPAIRGMIDRRIYTIKAVRALTGWGLKDAKDHVDAFLNPIRDTLPLDANNAGDAIYAILKMKNYTSSDEYMAKVETLVNRWRRGVELAENKARAEAWRQNSEAEREELLEEMVRQPDDEQTEAGMVQPDLRAEERREDLDARDGVNYGPLHTHHRDGDTYLGRHDGGDETWDLYLSPDKNAIARHGNGFWDFYAQEAHYVNPATVLGEAVKRAKDRGLI